MKISQELENILEYAREEAMRTGYFNIMPDHLFLGILREGKGRAVDFLRAAGLSTDELKEEIDSRISHSASLSYDYAEDISFARETGNLVNLAIAEAIKADDAQAEGIHLLRALMGHSHCNTSIILAKEGISANSIPMGHEKKPERESIPAKSISDLLSVVRINTELPS